MHPRSRSSKEYEAAPARRLGRSALVLCVLCALSLVGCGSSSSGSSSKTSAAASTSSSGTASAIASVPPGQLVSPGTLKFCTNFPAPPQEMYTTSGQPEGSDIDTGNAIAALLGLKPMYVQTNFDTIIEALSSAKCDLIITGIFITPERLHQINFVPYFTVGESLLVKKGNPAHLTDSFRSLCGKTISVQIGDAELTTAQGYSAQCKAAGLAPITLLSTEAVDTALEQLITGRAVAFFYDSPLIAYYAHTQPGQFQAAAPPVDIVKEGIGVTKNHPQLQAAVIKAMAKLEADGRYAAILKKWGLTGTKIPPPSPAAT
jgi:polar amino acid transport system substrate-binding protein